MKRRRTNAGSARSSGHDKALELNQVLRTIPDLHPQTILTLLEEHGNRRSLSQKEAQLIFKAVQAQQARDNAHLSAMDDLDDDQDCAWGDGLPEFIFACNTDSQP